MKQRMRRISALLLALVLCASMMVPAFAAEESANCPGVGQIHKKSNCSYGEAIAVNEAGCGKQGYTVYQCTECETYFADDFVESFGDHEWMYLVKDATCLEKGYYKKVCMNCGLVDASYEEAALGHKWDNEDCGNVTCERCGTTGVADDDIHNWSEPELVTAPKFTVGKDGTITVKPGKAELVCKDCGLEKEVPIELAGTLAHTQCDWVEYKEVPATCETPGKTGGKKCSICGKVEKLPNQTSDPLVTIPVIPCQAEQEWTVVFPDCTEAGSAYHACSMCDAVMGTPIALEPLGHGYQFKVYEASADGKTFAEIAAENEIATNGETEMKIYVDGVEKIITTADKTTETYAWTGEYVEEGFTKYGASCAEYSYIHYNCYICHSTVTVTLDPGHVWVVDEAQSSKADCTTDGTTVWVCANPNCTGKIEGDGDEVTTNPAGKAQKSETVTASGHNYVPVVTAPTCQEPGETNDICTNCGLVDPEKESYDKTAVDPNGHVPVDTVITRPTCTTPGVKSTVCDLCGEVLATGDPIPATGHTPDKAAGPISESDATCTEPAKKWYNCLGCNEKVSEDFANAKGHSYTNIVTLAPNCATGEPGKTLVYCANGCGQALNEGTNFLPFDRNNPAHHGNTLQEVSRVIGDCDTPDTVTYKCLACEYTFTTEDKSEHGNGHSMKGVDDKAATCVAEGNIAYKKCSRCDYITINGEEATLADTVIPALSADKKHGETVIVPAVDPTCTEGGNKAGEQCTVCGTMVVAVQNLDALGHNYELISENVYQYNKRTAACEVWGYEFHQCTNCGDEVILKYAAALEHVEEDREQEDPTCYSTGLTAGKFCTVCQEYTEGGEVIPKVPHTNSEDEEFFTFTDANGEEFAICTETVDPLNCKHCYMTFEKACEWVVTYVPATCNEYSYELWVCKNCEDEKMMNPGFDYSENHIGWSDWVIEKEATMTADGLKVRKCVCGMTEEVVIPALSGIEFDLEVDNATVSGAKLTNSGLVAVTIKTNTKSLAVWGIRMTVSFNNAALTFVSHDNANEKFADVQVAGSTSEVTVVAYASGEKDQDITLEGEEALVVLYFRVDSNEAVGTELGFSTGAIEVLDTANNEILLPANAASAMTKVEATLGYVTNDAVINLDDAHAMMKLIASEEYASAADIDLDGEVTPADFGLMQDRLLGIIDDEDLALAYIGDAE